MRMGCAGTGRDTVICVVNAIRNANIAIVVDKGDATASGPAFHRAVGNAAALIRQFAGFGSFFQMAFACFLGR